MQNRVYNALSLLLLVIPHGTHANFNKLLTFPSKYMYADIILLADCLCCLHAKKNKETQASIS